MKFKEKVVWITGASSGIGEALAYAFSQEGAFVAISARNQEALDKVRNACADPDKVMVAPLDVADFDRIPGVAAEIIERFGYLNILVNNAGISQRSLVKDTDISVDQKVMNVNFMGTVAVTKAVLPTMLHQHFGQIVIISSVMGKIGTPLRSAYAASKHALHGYFECLRAEVVDEGIGITIICPGYVDTNVTINALTGDGSPNRVKAESTANGLSPAQFAHKALKAIAAEKGEALIGGKELLTIYIQRFFPRLLRWIIRRVNVT
ncbi:SDR family oxidoreductase [Lewinella sp. LCG006]|uniref:SDR family oxidoreductase n=1 Tax=Lewinella sp. LCG006 TaxID=3231911 RepID=UPI003460C5FC